MVFFRQKSYLSIVCVCVCFLALSSCDTATDEKGSADNAVEKISSSIEKKIKNINFKKTVKKADYKVEVIPKNMTVQEKKKRFRSLLVPPIQKVYKELHIRYQKVSIWLEEGSHQEEIAALKEEYKAETDEELLAALKPHPPSIVIAQAAIESAWATSRFFVEAKNVFGVWSFNEDEPRIAAGEKRDGKKTIWVKKYATLEDSVRDYYRVLARGHAHQHFRDARLETNDPFTILTKLDRYSEIGDEYTAEIESVIRYNKLTEFGPVFGHTTTDTNTK